MLPSKYFLHQYKPSGDYPLKLSAAGTHCAQQLISYWKAGNAAQVAKVLVISRTNLSYHAQLILT